MIFLILVLEYTPSVIEPSFGIGRILYALLEHSYKVRPASGDAEKKVESKDASQIRAYFSFPASVAPTKALVLPLSNSPSFTPLVKSVVAALRRHNLSNKVDASSGSIGRRYARNDELGTSFAITVDFTSLEDGTVTLRERDSCRQIRASVDVVVGLVDKIVRGAKSWADVEKEFAIIESADDKE